MSQLIGVAALTVSAVMPLITARAVLGVIVIALQRHRAHAYKDEGLKAQG